MNTCNTNTEVAPAREKDETIHRPQFHTAEDENGATLHIALPGVRKDDLKLTLLESRLRIDAKRSDEVPEAWQTRRDTGAVSRYGLEIRLTPRLDGTRATASLEDGVLRLHVPVREEAKPKQIEVN